MKKVLLALALVICASVCANAQSTGQRFGSKQNNQEIETWKYIADNNKKNNEDWAKAVYQEFGLTEEGAIRHAFVINARDSFDIAKVMGITKMWVAKAFTNPGDTIMEYDVENRVIKARVALLGMGDAYGFGGFAATASEAHVTMPLDLTFQFKENRLRLETKIPMFILNSSDWVRDVVDKQLSIKDCFPANPKSNHKDSYSRAFINGNAKCLTSTRDYINYLNYHFSEKPVVTEQEKAKKAEDDW